MTKKKKMAERNWLDRNMSNKNKYDKHIALEYIEHTNVL